jgi:nitroimidazol reductase NimA-like FMN-containing flavoprotein (pyridoxamine 5'-phosphate oxidase superfamily)
MSQDDSLHLLRECGWGVIAVVEESSDNAVPVAVPTAYTVDGERLYLTMTTGRKREALRGNPHLCLTVADVRAFGRWRSVAVMGRARWLEDPTERARAIAAFTATSRPPGFVLTERDAARLGRAELLQLEVDELHGWAEGV